MRQFVTTALDTDTARCNSFALQMYMYVLYALFIRIIVENVWLYIYIYVGNRILTPRPNWISNTCVAHSTRNVQGFIHMSKIKYHLGWKWSKKMTTIKMPKTENFWETALKMKYLRRTTLEGKHTTKIMFTWKNHLKPTTFVKN